MADLFLNNGGMGGDLDAMTQAASKMDTAVENFVALCKSNMQLFIGQTADSLLPQLNKLAADNDAMDQNFINGQNTLSEMVDIHNNSDSRGAQILGQ